jgi:pSer/pThr/pTyr-binding forkhead associated (FHA) protein
MKSCPNCRHQEINGALFCSQCGAQIFDIPDDTDTFSVEAPKIKDSHDFYTPPPPFPEPPQEQEKSHLALYLIDSDEYVFSGNEPEITIGRLAEGQLVIPSIDLTPYDAYEAGVSRLHLCISIKSDKVTVKDLGSANGTRHNGAKTTPHVEQVLHHGDILTLGKLKVQVLLNK